MRPLIWLVSFLAAAIAGPKRLWEVRHEFLQLHEPAVRDSYDRVRRPGRTYHDLKNVAVEWTRADPQTAAKVLAFCALVGWGVALVAHL